MPSYKLSIMNLGAGGKLVGRRGHDPALRGAEVKGGRVAERSESSNPMIAGGNHTDSNGDRPYGCGVESGGRRGQDRSPTGAEIG